MSFDMTTTKPDLMQCMTDSCPTTLSFYEQLRQSGPVSTVADGYPVGIGISNCALPMADISFINSGIPPEQQLQPQPPACSMLDTSSSSVAAVSSVYNPAGCLYYPPPSGQQISPPVSGFYDSSFLGNYIGTMPHQTPTLSSSASSAGSSGSNQAAPNSSRPRGGKKRRRVATMAQRRAANIRERRRMFNLNEAFDTLRKRVPTFAYEKRLSRIETLRLAITYIAFMKDVMHGTDPQEVRLNQAHRLGEMQRYEQFRVTQIHHQIAASVEGESVSSPENSITQEVSAYNNQQNPLNDNIMVTCSTPYQMSCALTNSSASFLEELESLSKEGSNITNESDSDISDF